MSNIPTLKVQRVVILAENDVHLVGEDIAALL
jgi:hypothetical protein